MALEPLINGVAYSWSQITCNILGRDVNGITKVSYGEEQEMEDFYGAGNLPVERGIGPRKATASITLHMSEVEALQLAAPNGRLQDIPPFDIIVAYIPGGQSRTVRHVIRNVQFKNNIREVEQGAMNIPVELELITSHIVWNAG